MKVKKYLLFLTNSSFGYGIIISLLSTIFFFLSPINSHSLSLKNLVLTNNFKINLVITTITRIVTTIFIINIVAKPLTLDSPNINKIIATIMVVILASMILVKEFLLPSSVASSKLLPIFKCSFILSKLITLASTAIPIPSSIAAIPGRVNTPSIK